MAPDRFFILSFLTPKSVFPCTLSILFGVNFVIFENVSGEPQSKKKLAKNFSI